MPFLVSSGKRNTHPLMRHQSSSSCRLLIFREKSSLPPLILMQERRQDYSSRAGGQAATVTNVRTLTSIQTYIHKQAFQDQGSVSLVVVSHLLVCTDACVCIMIRRLFRSHSPLLREIQSLRQSVHWTTGTSGSECH